MIVAKKDAKSSKSIIKTLHHHSRKGGGWKRSGARDASAVEPRKLSTFRPLNQAIFAR